MTTTLIILCYFVQIPLSIYGLFFMPHRGELSTPMENGRRNVSIFGLLPCAFAAIFFQVIILGIYYARAKSIDAKAAGIATGWQTSGGSESGGNPFGGGSGSTGSQQLPQGNPFAAGSHGEGAIPPPS